MYRLQIILSFLVSNYYDNEYRFDEYLWIRIYSI
jgi:hypothetical protein